MSDAANTLNVNDDDLDALLGGLEIPDESIVSVEAISDDTSDVIEEPADEVVTLEATVDDVLDDETVEAIEAEMELQEARDSVYAGAESDGTDLDAQPEDAAPAAAAKPAKAPRAKKASAAKNPRISVETLPVDAFVLTTDIPEDLDANKAVVLNACPAQKKVKEKFDNILTAIHAGRAPSTYIMDCFRVLVAKGGEVTSPDLVAALKATSLKNGSGTYSEGTARSQVGQIMALFPALKIASRSGNKITLNPESLLAEALRGFDAPAAVEEIPAAAPAEDALPLAA